MKNILFTSIAASSLFFASCGDKKVDTGVDKTSLKPHEAVNNWGKDIFAGKIASLWDSFPSTYQSDVSGIVHHFGENVDAELYNEVVTTFKAMTSLLKNKKSMIIEIGGEMVPPSEKAKFDQASEKYDVIVALLDSIASSDIKEVNGLKKLDLTKFLGDLQKHTMELSSFADVAGAEVANFKDIEATLLSEDADSAEVELVNGDEKRKEKLVKKDDRWVPSKMVEKWPGMMKEAKESISAISKMKGAQKQSMIGMMKMVQGVIGKIDATKTKEEMKKEIQGVMQMM